MSVFTQRGKRHGRKRQHREYRNIFSTILQKILPPWLAVCPVRPRAGDCRDKFPADTYSPYILTLRQLTRLPGGLRAWAQCPYPCSPGGLTASIRTTIKYLDATRAAFYLFQMRVASATRAYFKEEVISCRPCRVWNRSGTVGPAAGNIPWEAAARLAYAAAIFM